MNIYLIRHGETKSNTERRYMGITDVPLSASGRSELILKKDEGYYPEYNGQLVFTSALSRTQETLKIIYGDVEYVIDPRFNEMNFGDFDNKTYEEIKDNPAYQVWISGEHYGNVTPNGESFNMLRDRVLKAYEDAVAAGKETGKDVIIVTHSGPIVAIREALHPGVNKSFYEWSIKNGEFYQISV